MFQRGLKFADNSLKVFGTARGLYEMGTTIAGAARSAYQVAGPAMAAAAIL